MRLVASLLAANKDITTYATYSLTTLNFVNLYVLDDRFKTGASCSISSRLCRILYINSVSDSNSTSTDIVAVCCVYIHMVVMATLIERN